MNTDMHGGKAMAGNTENGGGRRGSRWRIAGWTAAALLLLLPLVAMQFTDEVAWTLLDFVTAGSLLFGSALVYELATRNMITIKYRVAIGVVVMTALLYLWAELAVGIFTNWGS